MLKNKGLIRRRKKTDGNSRLKLRKKYEKAVKKIKGRGQTVRKQENKYQGELTGINERVIKGVSLKSKVN